MLVVFFILFFAVAQSKLLTDVLDTHGKAQVATMCQGDGEARSFWTRRCYTTCLVPCGVFHACFGYIYVYVSKTDHVCPHKQCFCEW